MKLGDTVAAMTKVVGIEPCEGCKVRQKKLNDLSDWLVGIFGGKNAVQEQSAETVHAREASGTGEGI